MRNFKITQSITNRQDASLGMFFKEVSKLPMIDSGQEIELSKRIKQGDNTAVNELVKANLRFVISVAKQYQNKGLPLVDLIQEGVLGMIEAAKRYNSDTGYRFISYAVWWIRQAIIKAISFKSRTVRLPVNQINNITRINKASNEIEKETGRIPSSEEVSEQINIKINNIANISNNSVSLDTPFKDGDDGSSCLLDVIPDDNIDTNLEDNEKFDKLMLVLNNLSPREHDVLCMSFGIGVYPMENEEIASRFGIGKERVRQIVNEAIYVLKTKYSQTLKEILQ